MNTHELKTWPEYFEPVWRGKKTAELRRDDRGYAVGDTLVLREWEPATLQYSGRVLKAEITHIVRGGEWLTPGMVMLSMEIQNDETTKSDPALSVGRIPVSSGAAD